MSAWPDQGHGEMSRLSLKAPHFLWRLSESPQRVAFGLGRTSRKRRLFPRTHRTTRRSSAATHCLRRPIAEKASAEEGGRGFSRNPILWEIYPATPRIHNSEITEIECIHEGVDHTNGFSHRSNRQGTPAEVSIAHDRPLRRTASWSSPRIIRGTLEWRLFSHS